eukprot:m51a1_g8447 putative protein hikeshi (209) ;mRNA; r:391616-392727
MAAAQPQPQPQSMFACVVAGRPVMTSAVIVPPNRLVFSLDDPHAITHIVVFLTGATPLPEGCGASVYIAWPPDYSQWRYMGHLTNEKPSAVFRVRRVNEGGDGDAQGGAAAGPAQLGISVETLEAIGDSLARMQWEGSSNSTSKLAFEDPATLPRRMLEHFWAFATSYATKTPQTANTQSQEWIPVHILNKWYGAVLEKLQRDPTTFR